jgi:hypothetical protein
MLKKGRSSLYTLKREQYVNVDTENRLLYFTLFCLKGIYVDSFVQVNMEKLGIN